MYVWKLPTKNTVFKIAPDTRRHGEYERGSTFIRFANDLSKNGNAGKKAKVFCSVYLK